MSSIMNISGPENRDRSRDRDRSRRGDKPSRFSDSIRDRSQDHGNDRMGKKDTAGDRRVYVSNIPYEYRWQDLKDLFRIKVGEVSFVELFVDENEKPRGCGIVEFADQASVDRCLDAMHRFEIKGRKLVVKEDFGNERDKYGRIVSGRRDDRDRDMRDDIRSMNRDLPSLLNMSASSGLMNPNEKFGNTYGLSPQFLESLGITGPLINRIFVANLDYKVDEKKLNDVFKLAGRLININLSKDTDGNSRGFAVIEYDHPVESVQAISMLHNQLLYDRRMTIRMDRADKTDGPARLPEGLKGIGMGLGANGDPLRDVRNNLPSMTQPPTQDNGTGAGILGAMPPQPLQGISAALSNVVGAAGSGLAGLTATQAAALQASLASVGGLSNPLLTNVANELGLGNINAGTLVSNPLTQNAALAATLAAANSNNMGGSGGGNFRQNDAVMNQSNSFNPYGGIPNDSQNRMSRDRDYDNSNRDYKDDSIDFRRAAYNTMNNSSQARSIGSAGLSSRILDTIIVSNLPPSATWQTLKDKFQTFGEIKYAEMKGKDIGCIRYVNERSAKEALQMMDRARIDGRTIDVRYF